MSRRRVTIQARELGDMTVNYLSLVKRGANRVPFRITKSGEDTMLDLSTLWFKKHDDADAEIKPAVVAIALAKSEHVETYTTALKDAGFEVVTVKADEESGAATLMLIDGDELPEDACAIKIDDEAAVILTGAKKGLDTYPDSNDFMTNVSGAGFFPSFRTATDLLHATMGNIAFSDGDAEATKSEIVKALSDFQSYVETLLGAVPTEAFKAEDAIAVAKGMLMGTGCQGEGEGKEDEAPAAPAAPAPAAPAAPAPAAPAAPAPAPAAPAWTAGTANKDGDDAGGDAGSVEEDSVEKSEADPVAQALVAMQSSIDSLATAVKASGDVSDGLVNRLDSLETQMKKTEEQVLGTVHSEGHDDVSPAGDGSEVRQKWDTALLDFGDNVEIV